MRKEQFDEEKIQGFCKSAAEVLKWQREYKVKVYHRGPASKDNEGKTWQRGLMQE
jgi:hypothetical protein